MHTTRIHVSDTAPHAWTLDLGANVVPSGVTFRVWAPAAERVELELVEPATLLPMERHTDGTWATDVPDVGPGARYKLRLNGGAAYPDPYSRGQPEGVHGASEVVSPSFAWHDDGWAGIGIRGLVIYQVHVGTASPEGTFDGLVKQLARIKSLGVGAIQVLPVAEFPGTRNWGYDGVDLFAPSRCYGGPGGLKRLVDAAHQVGLGVILDVVYNHFGPDGNYLRQYSPNYFTDRYQTPWGEAVNYDGEQSAWARKLVVDNARYWIHEFHADGLRLDATHAIFDRSARHILAELTDSVRASISEERSVVLIAESSENDVRYLLPTSEGGLGFDAVYADDFHHSLRRYLAGDHEGYYGNYQGTLAEVARIIEQGWLYEGQPSPDTGRPRGTLARQRPAWQFQYMLQNHDQVGNRPTGERLHHQVDLARYRVASALLLTLPYTPLLFMGQEFAASSPFQYFTDHNPELGRLVTEGRREEFRGWEAFRDGADRVPDPQAESTFLRSKLDLEEAARAPGVQLVALYRALLALRHTDAVLVRQDGAQMDARAVAPDVLKVHRWNGKRHRLLLANFGPRAEVPFPDIESGWRVLLSTDDLSFGGAGRSVTFERGAAVIPERTAVFLASGEDA